MTYLRSLFLNFLIVFFAARVVPGIQIQFFENVPNIGADIVFASVVGFFNSIIVPVMVGLNVRVTNLKILIFSFLVSFLGFFLIGIFNFGVKASFSGVIFGGLLVGVCSFFTNFLEFKHLNR